jgi:hypothetical protein
MLNLSLAWMLASYPRGDYVDLHEGEQDDADVWIAMMLSGYRSRSETLASIV